MVSETPQTLLRIRSCALPSQTPVPWEYPDSLTSISNLSGCVSTSICRVKPVPNSGMPMEPVFPMTGSSSGRPSAAGDLNSDMVSGSSSRISVAFVSVSRSSILIMVGLSWPSSSSFSR